MNVHSSSSGFRRAKAERAARRYGSALWTRLPVRLFLPILDRIDRGLMSGSLELHLPDGSIRMMGGREQGFTAIVHLDSYRALLRLAAAGSIGWFRAWEAEEWSSPDPVALFALFMANARSLGTAARSRGFTRLLGRLRHAWRRNSRKGARRNIADHYDLGNDFYALWLDETLTYSCARPAFLTEPLADAQRRKIGELLDRLDLKDGDQLLEIGCGWGGLAQQALGRAKIGYTGLTLSQEQRAEVLTLPIIVQAGDDAQVLLQDYRDTIGTYDAIASVEMVEAVGQDYWPIYLETIHRLLKPGGRAAIQFISIDDAIFPAYARRADFIQRYIFPGGCLISERRFRALAEARGLEWTGQSRFGLDYAWTLRQWRERFDAVVEAGLLPRRFDVHFVNMWRYYLMYCEGGFAGRGIDVAQVTLVKV
ncbi:MAG: class I SAM-dependent methyltransferase [Sphingobium sp.]|nr:class I SAM-dependent methyltransferase [Sphingobium sp.]